MRAKTLLILLCGFLFIGFFLASCPAAAQEKVEREAKKPARRAATDTELQKYLEVLSKFIASSNPKVKASVRDAFLAVGREAVPTLREIAKTGSREAKNEVKEILKAIEEKKEEPESKEDAFYRKMVEYLELTDEQKEKVDPIVNEIKKKREELREALRSGEISRQEVREKVQNLREEEEAKLKEILTEEQFEKFMEKRKDIRAGGVREGRVKKKDRNF